jgi:hypothetical protein
MAEGFLTVRFWRQEASDRLPFAAFGGLRSFDSELIPIFQTVSEGEFSEVRTGLQWVASCSSVESVNPLEL